MVGELVTYSKDLKNKFEYAIINNANRIKVENTNILKKGTYMKKFNTIVIISLLSLSMVACGSKDKPTKVTPDFTQKESAKETVKETIKETNKETEKETSKESEQTADKGTETKPSTPAKPSNPSKPSNPAKPSNPSKPNKPTPSRPSEPSKPNPSKPSKPEPSKPTPSKPAKKKVWVVDVPAKDAVYKTERVLVKPAKDAVYENKTVVVTPEKQKEEVRGRYVLVPSKGETYEFEFNTLAEKEQAYQNLLAKEEELLDNWVTSRYYQDFQTYYVTIPAVTKTEKVLVSEAQEAVYEDKRVLVSPEVKEKGHWEWR